jgi:hypothetical protein
LKLLADVGERHDGVAVSLRVFHWARRTHRWHGDRLQPIKVERFGGLWTNPRICSPTPHARKSR